MTDLAWGPYDAAAFGRRTPKRRGIPQSALCAAALLLSAPIGFAVLYARSEPPAALPVVAQAPQPVLGASRSARATPPAAVVPLRHYAALLDPAMIAGTSPAAFATPTALRAAFEPRRMAVPSEDTAGDTAPAARDSVPDEVAVADPPETSVVPAVTVPPLVKEIPLPAPRPDFADAGAPRPRAAARQLASAMPEQVPAPVAPAAAPAQGDGDSFFAKLFSPLTRPGSALGYAAVEPGEIGRPGIDRYTAVYDITAHTVTLPNGVRLEAHSGLGPYVDNPSSVALHMRGATPPNLYELTPREGIFHGVRALRLTPTAGTTYGRGGLLTHSYMLRGRSGESNGCVVFRNYEAFLAAYEAGQVRRLLVVARAG